MDDEATFDHVLDHVNCPHHRGSCSQPTHAAEMQIPSCGDRVRVELRIHGGHIAEAWFSGSGCCISQAAASMAVQYAESRSTEDIKSLRVDDMLRLLNVPLSPRRRACALLAWQALQEALFHPLNRPSADTGRATDR